MAKAINLNADMGEGFGAWEMGDDASLIKIIRSASIACGFHAGDPVTMHQLVSLAAAEGVSIGAHPGFNDLWGFGRRRIDTNPRELEYMIAYQIGALQAMAAYVGAKVTHVKTHGALNNMAAEDHRPGPGDRPGDEDGRPRPDLCGARRLADGEGGAGTGAAAWRAKGFATGSMTMTAT